MYKIKTFFLGLFELLVFAIGGECLRGASSEDSLQIDSKFVIMA